MNNLYDLAHQKKQVILQGPPGTGKTRACKILANNLIENKKTPNENQEPEIKYPDKIRLIQFHPAYSYEDFVRGIEAKTTDNGISYQTKDKVLLNIAKEAANNKESNYVLIIDEINRANLSAVLGELIYALEYRGEKNMVDCMYTAPEGGFGEGNKIYLPENLFILGTMNTADHSVGNIDYAIRRRFGFYSMEPTKEILKSNESKLFDKVKEIFDNYLSPEFAYDDVMIGHSYFMTGNSEEKEELEIKLNYDIKPILYEYAKDGILIDNGDKKVNGKIQDLTIKGK